MQKKHEFSRRWNGAFDGFFGDLPLVRDRPSLPGLTPSLTGSSPSSRSQLLSGGFQRVACYALFCTGQSTPSLLAMCIPVLLGMLKKSSLLCDICALLFFYVALTSDKLQVRVWYNSLYRTYFFSASIMYHAFLKLKRTFESAHILVMARSSSLQFICGIIDACLGATHVAKQPWTVYPRIPFLSLYGFKYAM